MINIRKKVPLFFRGVLSVFAAFFVLGMLVMFEFRQAPAVAEPVKPVSQPEKAVQESAAVTFADFVTPDASVCDKYTALVGAWAAKQAEIWGKNLSNASFAEIAAYTAEAAGKGNYAKAAAASSEAVKGRTSKTGLSSLYFTAPFAGRVQRSYYALSSWEKERMRQIKTAIGKSASAGSHELLAIPHVIDWLASRDASLCREAAMKAVSIPKNDITPALYPAILTLASDISLWAPDLWNKADSLAQSALADTLESLQKTEAGVFASFAPDALFNIRLGASISEYGKLLENQELEAAGRSLTLSSLHNIESKDAFSAWRLVSSSPYYPHETAVSAGDSCLSVWTLAPRVAGETTGDSLTLRVDFQANAAHYLILRGVKPFSKIRMWDTDWHTDSDFETYDAPGWVYLEDEQALLVKLMHRKESEEIRIDF